jgi:hypothetical protein
VFKVVWAAWGARRRSGAPADGDAAEALLNGNGNGGAHGASLYLPPSNGGGGMGPRSQSLQWLDAATESRVQGEVFTCAQAFRSCGDTAAC